MIVTSFYRVREDGVELLRTASDQNMKIQQIETGALYEEAIDTSPIMYTYTETDIPIDEEELTDSEALAILLGGDGE